MHFCDICNYLTQKSSHFKNHLKSKKHIDLLNIITIKTGETIEIPESNEIIESNEISENNDKENIFKCPFCNNIYR